jgi:hypothetical protein
MKQPKPGRMWYFVDEAGDPTFYGKRGQLIIGQEGCSPVLILGFIKTPDPESLRKAVRALHTQIVNDPYFEGRPSMEETRIAFHANKDVPEIKYLFFKLIASLDFQAQFVVARKIEKYFIQFDNRKQYAFYDHLISRLFESVMHLHEENHIYFAKRQTRLRQAPLKAAIEQSRHHFHKRSGRISSTSFAVQAQTPAHEPCLSIIDYLNWALYRAYTKREMNYFNVIQHKVSLVADIYDKSAPQRCWYDRRNPFHIAKVTPLQLVPSEGHTARMADFRVQGSDS